MTTHKTRGSSADREYHCAGAIGYDGPVIDSAGEEAALGTLVGDLLEQYATGEADKLTTNERDDAARDHGVSAQLLRQAYYGGLDIWEAVGPMFWGAATAQERLDGLVTCGTADLIAIAMPEGIAIHDWKLGLTDDWHYHQLMAYALAAVDTYGFPSDGHVTLTEGHCCSGEYRLWRVTEAQLDIFERHLRRQHERAGEQFAPGSWCRYCPRAYDCEPREAWIAGATSALIEGGPRALSRAELGGLWHKSRALKRALADYEALVEQVLTGGDIEFGDERLTLIETETETFDAGAVVAACQRRGLSIDTALKASKSGIERAVKAQAPKGRAAGQVREILSDLRDIGAVTTRTSKRIRCLTREKS